MEKIIFGQTEINESLLTGESKSINKGLNEIVFGGTVNGTGSIKMQVIKTFKQSRLSQIIRLLAQTTPSKLECTIDKFIPYFVITTLSLALLTFLYWFQVDTSLAILSAVSVLIITCPCGLWYCDPPLLWLWQVALGQKNNILIKNNRALEQLHQIENIIFDKNWHAYHWRDECH